MVVRRLELRTNFELGRKLLEIFFRLFVDVLRELSHIEDEWCHEEFENPDYFFNTAVLEDSAN